MSRSHKIPELVTMDPKTPALTGRAAEAKLHTFKMDECVEEEVLDYILPKGKPHAWEASLWDYKRKLPSTSGRGAELDRADAQDEIAELIKDIVAMHNSYGGYILAGIDQHSEPPIVGCENLVANGFTIEKLNEKIISYTRVNIECRFRKIASPETSRTLGLLLVPMRHSQNPIVQMARGAPVRNGRGGAFQKGDIYA